MTTTVGPLAEVIDVSNGVLSEIRGAPTKNEQGRTTVQLKLTSVLIS